MGESKTATVETLTAEVRVLMVGSRQITLSVYGQLDRSDEIVPFGRVRPRGAKWGWIYLIGRDQETGALARMSVPGNGHAIGEELRRDEYAWQWDDLERQAKRLEHQAGLDEVQAGKNSSWRDEFSAKAREQRDKAASLFKEAADLRQEYADEAAPLAEQAVELAKLPLIVLAGLR